MRNKCLDERKWRRRTRGKNEDVIDQYAKEFLFKQ